MFSIVCVIFIDIESSPSIIIPLWAACKDYGARGIDISTKWCDFGRGGEIYL